MSTTDENPLINLLGSVIDQRVEERAQQIYRERFEHDYLDRLGRDVDALVASKPPSTPMNGASVTASDEIKRRIKTASQEQDDANEQGYEQVYIGSSWLERSRDDRDYRYILHIDEITMAGGRQHVNGNRRY